MKKIPVVILGLVCLFPFSCSNPTFSAPKEPTYPEVEEPSGPVVTPTAPAAPDVSAATPTNETRPRWSWNVPSGAVSFRYSLDDSAWKLTTLTSFAPDDDLAAGSHSLEVQAKNNTGPWSQSGSKTIVIDLSAPDAPVVSAASPTMNPRPFWYWTVPSGSVALRYKYDNLEWTAIAVSSTSFAPSTDLEDGEHRFEIQAKNAVGNWSAPGILVVTVDTVAPLPVTLNAPQFSNNARPTWSWSTPSDAVRVRFSLDGVTETDNTAASTGSYTPNSALQDGSHEFKIQSRDSAGNWSVFSTRSIVVDTVPCEAPTVVGKTITNEPTPQWSWTSPEEVVLFRYSLDESPWETTTETVYVPAEPLSAGNHTLMVQAADNAKNWSSSAEWTIMVDPSVPPSPTLSANSPTNAVRPVWTITVPSGAVGLRYRLDDDSWTPLAASATIDWAPPFDLTEGPHTLEVQTLNAAGTWSSSASKIVTVDLTAPDAPIVTAVSPTDDFTPTWTWSVPATSALIEYRVNGGDWVTVPASTTAYTPSSEFSAGTAVLDARAVDLAGNRSPMASMSVEMGYFAPSNLVAIAVSNITVKLTWTDNSSAESGFVIERKVAGGSFSSYDTVRANVTTWSSYNHVASTEYTYRVRAQYSGAYSDYSAESTATTYPSVNKPTNLTYTGDGSGYVTLTWTDNADNETSYEIEYGTGSSSSLGNSKILPANSTEGQIFIYPSNVVTVRVIAKNEHAGASADVYLPANEVSIPVIVNTGAGEGYARLMWSAAPNATGYAVERAEWDFHMDDSDWSQVALLPDDTLSYEDTAVQGPIYYAYRIRAFNLCSSHRSAPVNIGVPKSIATFGETYAAQLTYNDEAWFSFDAEQDKYYKISLAYPQGSLITWVYNSDKTKTYEDKGLSREYTIHAKETGKVYIRFQFYLGEGQFSVKVSKTPSLSVSYAGTKYPRDSKLTLPTQSVGVSNAYSFHLTNVGDEPLKVSSIGFSPYGSGCCRLDSGIPGSIQPGETWLVLVEYAPTSPGTMSDDLVIVTDDPADRYYTVTIGATVRGPSPKVCVFQEDTELYEGQNISCGTVPFGSSKTVSFSIRNFGDATLVLNGSPKVTSDGSFSLLSGPSSLSIAPGGSKSFTVLYKPVSSGTKGCNVTISSNDPFAEDLSFMVFGTCSAAKASLSINGVTKTNGQDYDWGTVFAGESKTGTLSITNSGQQTLTVACDVAGPYLILDQLEDVAPGETKTVGVRCTANSVGGLAGSLTFSFNDPSLQSSKITFTGTAIAGTLLEIDEQLYGNSVSYFGDYDWFYFAVTAGDVYSIWCDDVADGAGGCTGDVKLSGYNGDFENVYFTNRDNSWDTPISVTATSTGIIAIKASQSTSYSSGTYRIAMKKTE